MDPLGQLVEPVPGRVELRAQNRVVCQEHRDLGEPPLGAVPKLLLEPPTLLVGGLDDPPPGSLDLGGPRSHLGLEPDVRDRESDGGVHAGAQFRVVEHRGVVHQDGKTGAAVLDRRHDPIGRFHLEALAGLVHVRGMLREPVPDRERRIAEGARKALRDEGRAPLAEVDHETGHGCLRPPAEEEIDGQHRARRADREVVERQYRTLRHTESEQVDKRRERERAREDARRRNGAATRSSLDASGASQTTDGQRQEGRREHQRHAVVAAERIRQRVCVHRADRETLES